MFLSRQFLTQVSDAHGFTPEEQAFFENALNNDDPLIRAKYCIGNVNISEAMDADPNEYVVGPPFDMRAYISQVVDILATQSSSTGFNQVGIPEFVNNYPSMEDNIRQGLLGLYTFQPVLCFVESQKLSYKELREEIRQLAAKKSEMTEEEYERELRLLFYRANIHDIVPSIEVEPSQRAEPEPDFGPGL